MSYLLGSKITKKSPLLIFMYFPLNGVISIGVTKSSSSIKIVF